MRTEILVHTSFKAKMAKKHNTTRQTVSLALKYYNNSPLARLIRKEVKNMRIEEANKIENYLIEPED